MACLTIALFFLRFWRQTGDRLFVIFAAAFGLLMVERLLLAAVSTSHELAPYIYVVRLFAFVLIMGAVVDKNRKNP